MSDETFGTRYLGPRFVGTLDPATGDLSGTTSDGKRVHVTGAIQPGPCVVTTADLPAGRELDALVAERVMGCKVVPEFRCGCEPVKPGYALQSGYPIQPHSGKLDHDCCGYDDCREDVWSVAPYSTDIASAWEVLERISAPPAGCDPDDEIFEQVEVYRNPVGTWTCKIPADVLSGGRWGHGDTAAEAICRAALAWAARKP